MLDTQESLLSAIHRLKPSERDCLRMQEFQSACNDRSFLRLYDVVTYPSVVAKVVGVEAVSYEDAVEKAADIAHNQIRTFVDRQPIHPDHESKTRGEIAYVAYADDIRDFSVEPQQPLDGEEPFTDFGVSPRTGEYTPTAAIERQARKEADARELALEALSKAFANAYEKLSTPGAVISNIDRVRFAEAMQRLDAMSGGNKSSQYYDSVATERPYLVQKCTTEVDDGVTKTIGYRAVMRLAFSDGRESTSVLAACKADGLDTLRQVVASANELVVDAQLGYSPTPELVTNMPLFQSLEEKGQLIQLEAVQDTPTMTVETLPVKWVTWVNPDYQQRFDADAPTLE